jgi:nitroreductase
MTRRFAAASLDLDEVMEVCDLARRAPSAGFSQGSHLVVLEGASLEQFWNLSGAGDWFNRTQPGVLAAPVVVVGVADPQAYVRRYGEVDKAGHGLEQQQGWPVPFWLTDTAMVLQNLLLLAEDRRWGALLFGVFHHGDDLLNHWGAPEPCEVVAAVALGQRADDDHPTGSPTRRPRRERDAVVHLHHW